MFHIKGKNDHQANFTSSQVSFCEGSNLKEWYLADGSSISDDVGNHYGNSYHGKETPKAMAGIV